MESIKLLRDTVSLMRMIAANLKLGNVKLKAKIEEAASVLESMLGEISVDNVELARLINSKAREVYFKMEKNGLTSDVVNEINRLVKWCRMAPYDFTDRIKYVRRGYRSYLYGMIIFFIVAGTYTQAYAISALILALPTVLAMMFTRRRLATGLMLAFSTIPLPLAIFSWTAHYSIYALINSGEALSLAGELGLPVGLIYMILLLYLTGSISGMILLSAAVYYLYRNRYAFI